MAAPKKADPAAPIRDLAAECFEVSGDNVANTRGLMARKIRNDGALTRIFLDHCLEQACAWFVHEHVRNLRGTVSAAATAPRDNPFPEAKPDRALSDGGLVSLAQGNRLDFRLWGGKRLGDATREEIQESANRYYSQARTMHITGRWLALVARAMAQQPEEATAEEVLTNENLDLLQLEAEREDG